VRRLSSASWETTDTGVSKSSRSVVPASLLPCPVETTLNSWPEDY